MGERVMMVRRGLLDRKYAMGPLCLTDWNGKQVPLDVGCDIGDLVTGNRIIAHCEPRAGWPPEVVVTVERDHG